MLENLITDLFFALNNKEAVKKRLTFTSCLGIWCRFPMSVAQQACGEAKGPPARPAPSPPCTPRPSLPFSPRKTPAETKPKGGGRVGAGPGRHSATRRHLPYELPCPSRPLHLCERGEGGPGPRRPSSRRGEPCSGCPEEPLSAPPRSLHFGQQNRDRYLPAPGLTRGRPHRGPTAVPALRYPPRPRPRPSYGRPQVRPSLRRCCRGPPASSRLGEAPVVPASPRCRRQVREAGCPPPAVRREPRSSAPGGSLRLGSSFLGAAAVASGGCKG
ncbi:proline-rich protein 2-like [Calypte anna]|uniref:proline-rich protein 2-like n=1 Tax=Calypte anna TaxID=9244 RepID=UPI0011C435AF|nr:proline-rich protein 2-like [Calypte anna]